jgi:nicotinate-nucleotide--dimethylbenzimidazole phosphoribosyltransferase
MHNLEKVTKGILPTSAEWSVRAQKYLDGLAIPHGSLGELLVLARRLAAMQETLTPSVKRKVIVTMAGDHGVVEEGISAFPQEVTRRMVDNFVRGGASINVLADVVDANVLVVDMGVAADLSDLVSYGRITDCKVAHGTKNMAKEPAMTRDQAVRAIMSGVKIASKLIVEDGAQLLATGDMGIGNTTPSAAILSVMGGLPVSKTVGYGSGISDAALEHKVQVIEQAISSNSPDSSDPIDVLAKIGGFEIAGIAGLILGAAYHKTPVIVDGFISTAGALIAQGLAPDSIDYMIASHCSVEPGHIHMWNTLGLTPLLNLGLRLGEGTGAAMAMNIVECAARVMTDVLTFEQTGISANEDLLRSSELSQAL